MGSWQMYTGVKTINFSLSTSLEQFILTADTAKSETLENDDNYVKTNVFGYCAPKQQYCGATLPLYEIQIETKHKRGQFLILLGAKKFF